MSIWMRVGLVAALGAVGSVARYLVDLAVLRVGLWAAGYVLAQNALGILLAAWGLRCGRAV